MIHNCGKSLTGNFASITIQTITKTMWISLLPWNIFWTRFKKNIFVNLDMEKYFGWQLAICHLCDVLAQQSGWKLIIALCKLSSCCEIMKHKKPVYSIWLYFTLLFQIWNNFYSYDAIDVIEIHFFTIALSCSVRNKRFINGVQMRINWIIRWR